MIRVKQNTVTTTKLGESLHTVVYTPPKGRGEQKANKKPKHTSTTKQAPAACVALAMTGHQDEMQKDCLCV